MSFEEFLDKVQEFADTVDTKKILRALKILLGLAKIAFRFVPMTDDERAIDDLKCRISSEVQ